MDLINDELCYVHCSCFFQLLSIYISLVNWMDFMTEVCEIDSWNLTKTN
jgi:hypothetical protein